MGFWKDLGNAVMSGVGGAISGGIGGGISNLFGSVFNSLTGNDSKSLQNQQTAQNKDMALWNMQNITKPVFEMENKEFDRRFAQQNAEWERQFNLQNEYNSIPNQLAQMRQGGLNPAMAIDGNTFQSAAQGAVGNPSVNEAASAMANPANVYEAKMTDANIRNMEMKNQILEREIQEKTINNKTLAQLNAGQVELQNVTISQTIQETEESKARTKLTYTQRRKEKALMRQIDEDTKNIIEQRDLIKEQRNQILRQITLSYYTQENLEADTKQKNAQTEYQKTVNKYADQNQKWLIKTMMAKFNLDEASAKQAYEMGKNIAIGTEEATWAFGRRKDRWNAIGQWDLSFQGARAQANWKGTPLQITIDEAARQWQGGYNTYMAGYWMADNIVARMQRGAAYMQNSGAQPNSGTPSYQSSDTY